MGSLRDMARRAAPQRHIDAPAIDPMVKAHDEVRSYLARRKNQREWLKGLIDKKNRA